MAATRAVVRMLTTAGPARSARSAKSGSTCVACARALGGTSGRLSASTGDKIKLLNFNLSPLTYDFIIARKIGRGITTPTFNWDAQSDPEWKALAAWVSAAK